MFQVELDDSTIFLGENFIKKNYIADFEFFWITLNFFKGLFNEKEKTTKSTI